MYFDLGGDGPHFSLYSKNLNQLEKFSIIDFQKRNINARIALVNYCPNLIVLPNGAFDSVDGLCSDEILLQRFPHYIAPHEFKGVQYYLLEIQNNFFYKLVEKAKQDSNKMSSLHFRSDYYDRLALTISVED